MISYDIYIYHKATRKRRSHTAPTPPRSHQGSCRPPLTSEKPAPTPTPAVKTW